MVNTTQANGSSQSFRHHAAGAANSTTDNRSANQATRLDQLRDSPSSLEQISGRQTEMSRFASQRTTAEQLAAGENKVNQTGIGTNGPAPPTAATWDTTHADSPASVQSDKASHQDAKDMKGAERFEGVKAFDAIAQGNKILKKGSTGADVKKVQQALIDMGYNIPGGASGTYGLDTHDAIRHFQHDAGIGVDGRVGKNTLEALKQQAPAPGQKLVRSLEYDKLFADGRLDTTIAIGFDEYNLHERQTDITIDELQKAGYKKIEYGTLSDADKAKFGLTGDRYDPNGRYFHKTFTDAKTGKDVESVVRLIDPGTANGKTARASFMKAIEQDEVVLYTGHARHGTGPDFDHKANGDGNFVINEAGNRHHSPPPKKLKDAIKGRGSDLDQIKAHPNYQLLIMNGCSTTEYLPSLRSAMFNDRNPVNTDLIVTNNPSWVATGGNHNLAFLNGITQRQSQPEMAAQHNRIETDHSAVLNHDGVRYPNGNPVQANEGYNTYFTNGLFDNNANQTLPK